jgi:hypothetical protein
MTRKSRSLAMTSHQKEKEKEKESVLKNKEKFEHSEAAQKVSHMGEKTAEKAHPKSRNKQSKT